MKMKTTVGLALMVAVLLALIVFLKDLLGMQAFFMGAIAMVMFAVLGPFGDYFKAGLSIVIGVIVGFAGIIALALTMPLPPDNTVYIALVFGLSAFLLVILSLTGLSIPSMFIGWAGSCAALYNTYATNTTALAATGPSAVLGVTAAMLLGLCMSVLIMKAAMAINE